MNRIKNGPLGRTGQGSEGSMKSYVEQFKNAYHQVSGKEAKLSRRIIREIKFAHREGIPAYLLAKDIDFTLDHEGVEYVDLSNG